MTGSGRSLSLQRGRRGEGGRSELHLCVRKRGVFALPVDPHHTLIVGADVVESVEVGLVAVLVPPAPHVGLGTVDPKRVWVSVVGGERPTVVVFHGVTCGSGESR